MCFTATQTIYGYYQCGSCKSEHTFAEKNLFINPNYDFLPVFGEEHIGTAVPTILVMKCKHNVGTVVRIKGTGQKITESSATANHALRQGREVIITRHLVTKIEGATLVKNPRELKDVLGLD